MSLFDSDIPGSLNTAAAIRFLLIETIKDGVKQGQFLDREELAAKMSTALGMHVTEAMLNAFTAESKAGHRFPAEFIIAIQTICGSNRFTAFYAKSSGGQYVTGKDESLLKLGRIQKRKEKLEREEQAALADCEKQEQGNP